MVSSLQAFRQTFFTHISSHPRMPHTSLSTISDFHGESMNTAVFWNVGTLLPDYTAEGARTVIFVSHLFNPTWFDHSTNVWRRAQIMQLLIMVFSSFLFWVQIFFLVLYSQIFSSIQPMQLIKREYITRKINNSLARTSVAGAGKHHTVKM
jgi:hypothetical protein